MVHYPSNFPYAFLLFLLGELLLTGTPNHIPVNFSTRMGGNLIIGSWNHEVALQNLSTALGDAAQMAGQELQLHYLDFLAEVARTNQLALGLSTSVNFLLPQYNT